MDDQPRCEGSSVELGKFGDLEHTSNRDDATETAAARDGEITVHKQHSLSRATFEAHVPGCVQHGEVIGAGRFRAEDAERITEVVEPNEIALAGRIDRRRWGRENGIGRELQRRVRDRIAIGRAEALVRVAGARQ